MAKLRILCLHGYHGSAAILRDQLRGLAAAMAPSAELVFVDAPSLRQSDFGWWHAVRAAGPPGDAGVDGKAEYRGWSRTRDWLVQVFAEQGPFDGVFGFSQGAALTGLLPGLRAANGKPTAERPLHFDFAMMVGGFPAVDAALAALYENRDGYALPSLHIAGRSDGIVPRDRSSALAAKFAAPVMVQHDGGHVIASTPEVSRQVAAFLEARRQAKAAPAATGPDPSTATGLPTAPRAPLEVPLWPGRPQPALRVSFPAQPRAGKLPALLIFQGGGYATSAGSGGGADTWAASQGLVGIRVPYGTRENGRAYPENYADAARAVRIVRQHAASWGIDASRIGVMGFSAGGHLASLLSTQPELYRHPEDDLAGQVSARPDLVVLAYPVISFVAGYSPGALAGSADNFFGTRNPGEAQRRQFSSELHVTAQHPPVFIWTTATDTLVPAEHSRLFAAACQRAGVRVQYTEYPDGAHGLGLALDYRGAARDWTRALVPWLEQTWGR